MKAPLLLLSCLLLSAASGDDGYCNVDSFQKHSISSPLLFSCDNSQLMEEIASLHEKIDELKTEVSNFINAKLNPGTSRANPASSCSEITTRSSDGTYWLSSGTQADPVQVTCDFNIQLPPLSPVPGWLEIANIDMRDPSQSCPAPWRESTFGNSRRCERDKNGWVPGCGSVLFPTGGVAFTKLCGRAVGYAESNSLNGFNLACQSESNCDINDVNNDGISIITDDPNNQGHIWSLAVSRTAVPVTCPCVYADRKIPVPDFVGEDYYCDHSPDRSYTLWDGEGCNSYNVECCSKPNQPWFCREFDQPVTTDNVEVRICSTGPIIELDMLKLYIQ